MKNLNTSTSNAMESELISTQVAKATLAYKEFDEARDCLKKSIKDWLASRVTIGEIIDLSYENARAQGIPEYMSSHQVIQGNARKAKRFKIVSINDVQVNISHFTLTQWTASAIPINEDGKELSGRVAKALAYGKDSNKDLVTLRFDLFRERF